MFDGQLSDLGQSQGFKLIPPDKKSREPGTRKKETRGRRCSDRNLGGTGKAERERSKRRREEEERGREKKKERRGRGGGGDGGGGDVGRTGNEKE